MTSSSDEIGMLDTLESMMTGVSLGSAVIRGQKRVGKTSIARALESRLRSEFPTSHTAYPIAPIGLHECRHTFASLMIAAGVNAKALSTYMGHSSIMITLDRYGHLMPGAEPRLRRTTQRVPRKQPDGDVRRR